MDGEKLEQLSAFYKRHLLENILPWWETRFMDKKDGGFLVYRDADGSLLSTDKPVWSMARSVWMWSRLYNTVEKKPDWLDIAAHGIDFLIEHAFDTDGRMFFTVTKEGLPLRKRRYLFSETFGAIAFAEYARTVQSEDMLERAREIYRLILMYYRTPGLLPPKVLPSTRTMRGHGMNMILIATSQILRQADPKGRELYDDTINRSIDEIFNFFVKPEKKCLLEAVLSNGKILDTSEGRTVLPGHAIETSWFIMEEANERGDGALMQEAIRIMQWSLEKGWDSEHGGILYHVDCDGKPAEPYEHELKLWWVHTEALYATLLAYYLTGEDEWLDWFKKVHDWSFRHFPDMQHGEWFGYLRRDGTVSSRVKGNMWKGPFHLPRALLNCWQLLERMKDHSE
ncbi:MAG: AGE family epimerase/isomerase [Candidatus Hydrogenedentota bacterium]